jgi:malate synthase
MEDAATAEISRAQIWQWIRHGARLADGRPVTAELYTQIRAEELARLGGPGADRYGDAAAIIDGLILNETFTEFLTLPAYRYLD